LIHCYWIRSVTLASTHGFFLLSSFKGWDVISGILIDTRKVQGITKKACLVKYFCQDVLVYVVPSKQLYAHSKLRLR